MADFYDVSDEIQSQFKEIVEKKSLTTSIKFLFVGSEKQKQLIKISKIKDELSYALNDASILVTINEDIHTAFFNTQDMELVTILFEQEVDKIHVNDRSGKVSIKQPSLKVSPGIINKYGIDAVARANQVEELTIQQNEDKTGEFIA